MHQTNERTTPRRASIPSAGPASLELMPNPILPSILVLLVTIGATIPSGAVINPSLQPVHLADRYVNVLSCRVAALDRTAMKARLTVEGVAKGEFAAKEISLSAADGTMAEAILSLQKGQSLVAYAGKTRRRRENDILYYAGSGIWYLATMEDGPGQWKILSNADKGKDPSSSEIMFGTFNGEVESLWEMMEDNARNTDYFPAVPLTRFSAQVIGSFKESVWGVAIHDVNGDARPDLFACSSEGNRLYIQDAQGAFVDRSEAFGLEKTSALSCSFADVDADGDADLLLNDTLFRQVDGRFTKSSDIPTGWGCHSASFMEYDGDGYPDVVVARGSDDAEVEPEGLALYRNPGPSGGAFEDRTAESGLAEAINSKGLSGYFEVCDWDVDGRTDLIYMAGPGYLLWQSPDGVYEPSELVEMDTGLGGGTAAFGTITRPDQPSVYLVAGDHKSLVCEESGGALVDVLSSGNEIQDPVAGLRMTVAEDLNADGTVDLYAASLTKGMSSFYVANRGYASFMLPEKYQGGKVIPPAVYNRPAWGLAVGDVNGDGALDVLVGGGRDGNLTLLVNETLTDRPAQADPSTTHDLRKQIQTRIVTVRPTARLGRTGCRLTLLDDKGQPVTHRWTGTNVGVGCCGPAQLTLAVREPGSYTLLVRLGDGSEKKLPLVIDEKSPRHRVLVVD